MRLASIATDFWELRSAEESHASSPERFWIPEASVRGSLQPGQGAKLIFDVETNDPESGSIQVGGERMWVIVAERIGSLYVGVLDNEPATIEPDDQVYLVEGAEIPFGPEHVVDVGQPPPEYSEWRLQQPRSRTWPRT